MHVALRVVIRVEQEVVAVVEYLVTARVRAEDEALEEPGSVSQMPLSRADALHRLDDVVFRLQRADEFDGGGPDSEETFSERCRTGSQVIGSERHVLPVSARSRIAEPFTQSMDRAVRCQKPAQSLAFRRCALTRRGSAALIARSLPTPCGNVAPPGVPQA